MSVSFLSSIWDAIKNLIAGGLDLLHGWFSALPFISDQNAWGWAIIGLTIFVRILLIPLAVKQFRSMRAMQELQPQIKAVQKKYKVDRSMMKSDPERYRKLQAKKNEELQRLYKENNVNPAAGCLPLLAQGPVFFALYSVLRDPETLGGRLSEASFYMFDSLGETASAAGIAGWVLIVGVAASMFVSQKQMMARNTSAAGDAQATQQKVMLYVMPLMMGFFGYQLPVGVLLYWVTTNVWTMVQQAFILRESKEEAEEFLAKHPEGLAPGSVEGSAGNTRRAVGDEPDTESTSGFGRKKAVKPKPSPKSKPPPESRSAPSTPDTSKPATGSKSGTSGTSADNGDSTSSNGAGHLPTRPSRRK